MYTHPPPRSRGIEVTCYSASDFCIMIIMLHRGRYVKKKGTQLWLTVTTYTTSNELKSIIYTRRQMTQKLLIFICVFKLLFLQKYKEIYSLRFFFPLSPSPSSINSISFWKRDKKLHQWNEKCYANIHDICFSFVSYTHTVWRPRERNLSSVRIMEKITVHSKFFTSAW